MTPLALTCLSLLIAQPEVNPVTPSLISEHTGLLPGKTGTIALQLDLEPGWHVYWDGYNDSGIPPSVTWDVPDGVKIGPIQWPAPTRYTAPGQIVDHIYEGRVTLLVPVTIPSDTPLGTTLDLKGKATWMVCADYCLLGSGTVAISLPVTIEAKASPKAKQIAAARQAVPKKKMPGEASIAWQAQTLHLGFPGARRISFYPGQSCVELVSLYDDAEATGSTLTLRTSGAGDVAGIVDVIKADGSRVVFEIKEPTPS